MFMLEETYSIKYNIKYTTEKYWKIGEIGEVDIATVANKLKDNHEAAGHKLLSRLRDEGAEDIVIVTISYV